MGILVDQPVDVQVDLNQESEAENQKPQEEQQNARSIPDKFKDKSAEEIAHAYQNLESELGRMRNELGDYRSMTDRFLSLEEKRVADLGNAEQSSRFEIDPTELLSNPEEVLDRYYEHRRGADETYAQMQARLDRLEGQVTTNSIQERHPDAADVANSPQFQSWLQEKSYRTRIAQAAVQNQDVEALDDLLTEFKGGVQQSPSQDSNKQNELAAAKAAGTESSSTGTTVNTGKRFSRRKLVELKMRNPDEYAARSAEILRAYAEKRVDD